MTWEPDVEIARVDNWISRCANLHVYRAKGGPAPHKPLLLLVLLDLASQGSFPLDVLPLSPELGFRFCTFWGIVSHRRTQKPDIRLPFFHMQSDDFWSPLARDKTPADSPKVAVFAVLNPEFRVLLNDPDFRRRAMNTLIAGYFLPDEQISLRMLLGLPNSDDAAPSPNPAQTQVARQVGREARFRLTVVDAYRYTCSLTQYQLTTTTAGTIVDAAHIHQFADSRNNDPKNGIALCKNAHWQFDNGLWTLDDEYRVLVAKEAFIESGPYPPYLRDFHGRRVLLPESMALWPDLQYIKWHREQRFQGQ